LFARAGNSISRQLDRKLRSLARSAIDLNRATVRVDDRLDNVQTEAKAAIIVNWHSPLEAIEDARYVLLSDTNAPIPHLQPSPATHCGFAISICRRPGGYGSVNGLSRAKLDGVGDEVRNDLLEPLSIPFTDHGILRRKSDLAAALGRFFGKMLDDVARELRQIELFRH